MEYIRKRAACERCPLRDHQRVWSRLGADGRAPLIAIVGEAPGEVEEKHKEPFVGPSGNLVNWALHECEIDRRNVYIANTICCRPTNNAIDSLEASEALGFCRAGLYDELREQYARGLRVVIALGPTAMKQLGLEGSLSKYRGSVMKIDLRDGHFLTAIPTYHPSAVLRNNWTRQSGGTARGAMEWIADWMKATKIARDGEPKHIEERFNLDPSVEDIEAFCADAVANKRLVAVDIETTGLSFDTCKIVMIGLATSNEDALVVPLSTNRDTPRFTNGNLERVRTALGQLFSQCPQIYQNCYFDVPRLRAFGFTIPYDRIAHDTMLLHHTLAAEAPHDLGYITSIYGATPYWKEEFKNRSGSIFDMDQIEARRYNARDCVVLHQVLTPMLAELKKYDLEKIYHEEVIPLIHPIMEMTQNGIGIHMGRVRKHRDYLERLEIEKNEDLYKLGGLPKEFNVASTSHMRWLLYSDPISGFAKIDERDAKNAEKIAAHEKKLSELWIALNDAHDALANAPAGSPTKALEKRLASAEKKYEAQREKDPRDKPTTQIERDIEALRVVRDQVKPIYTLRGYQPQTTQSGLLATDREGLLAYKIALTNRRAQVLSFSRKDGSEEAEAIDRLLAFMDLAGEVGRIRKIKSTYTLYETWSDGRVHPYWKQHGTASGRLASTSPNLQNTPAPDPDHPDSVCDPIRSFFVARPGHKLLSADYVNLEAQLLAYSTLDPELVSVFEHGKNLHDVNTAALFNVTEDSPEWHPCRRAAKIDFFGNKCYGGSDYAIYQKIMLEVPELRMTLAEYRAANARWFSSHPAYAKWATNVRETVKATRKAYTPFGRARFFFHNDRDIEKEALNHMIQSSGASLVNRAMIRIQHEIDQRGLKTRFVAQVHDELILEAPEDEVEVASKILVDEMGRPFSFLGYERKIPVQLAIGDDMKAIA